VKAESPVSKPSESDAARFETQLKTKSPVFEQMKPTGKGRIGIGERSAKESASAAAEFSVFGALRSPNQALLPTTMSVTIPAAQEVVPDMVAADL
jgi:hypothetical protein